MDIKKKGAIFMFEKWKEKKESKKKKRDPYYVEELRLTTLIQELKPGTEEYKEIQQELKNNNQMRGESAESKRRISKADKGGIIIKCLGILGAGAGIGSIIWAETRGLTFTGEKRKIMDSISTSIGKIFFNH